LAGCVALGVVCIALRAGADHGARRYVQYADLIAPGTSTDDHFGAAVAIDGERAIVGAPGYGKPMVGAAYVFVRDGSEWVIETVLTPSGPGIYRFGESVGLAEGRAVVEGCEDAGCYVFLFDLGGPHLLESRLLPRLEEGDSAGGDVAISPELVAIRGSTAASAYPRAAGTDGSDPSNPPPAPPPPPPPPAPSDVLAAVVFALAGDGEARGSRLVVPSSGVVGISGAGLAISGSRVLAPTVNGGVSFVRSSSGTWTLEQSFAGMIGYAPAYLALVGERAVIGIGVWHFEAGSWTYDGDVEVGRPAILRDGIVVGTWHGAVRVFGPDPGSVTGFRVTDELRSDGDDSRSPPVATSGDRVVVSPSDGSAYVAHLFGAACERAANCTSGHCVDGVCCNESCGGPCQACSEARGATADGACATLGSDAAGDPVCAPLVCNGISPSCSPCSADTECLGAEPDTGEKQFFCSSGGSCVARAEQGRRCDSRDCASPPCGTCVGGLVCVEGVCCDRSCSAAESCRADRKASGADGTCGSLLRDPLGRRCEEPAACDTGHCVDGVCCNRECSPVEACVAALKVAGDDGTCGSAFSSQLGQSCKDGSTCDSGYCVDGVCCDTPCDGLCMGCRAAVRADEGADGTCGPVVAGFDPTESCPNNPACSARPACDGMGRCTCSRPVGTCSATDSTVLSDDSTGTRESSVDCSPYRCANGACLVTCADPSDCALGVVCGADQRCGSGVTVRSQRDPGPDCQVGPRPRPGLPVACALGVVWFLARRRRPRSRYAS